jgi:hypothetical protein
MFQYWSAPPSLLRVWARPEEPSPAMDGRFRFGSPAVKAREECGSRLSRIGRHVRALFFSRKADSRLSTC